MVATLKMLAIMFKHPYADVVYAAPSHPLIKQILYPKVVEILEEAGIGYKINRSDATIKIEGHGSIICKTLENPDLLVGFECISCFIDEMDLLPTEKANMAFMKLSARIRQKFKPNPDGTVDKNQVFITTTPEGRKWVFQNFVKDPIKNSHLIQMSTYSNRENLPEGYIESLEDKFGDTPMLAAYLKGEFVNMEGNRVLPNYDRVLCDSDRKMEVTDKTIYISCDFNVTKQEAVVWVKDTIDNKTVFTAVDEFNKMYDTPEMISIVQEKYGTKQVMWYPDASGSSRKSVDASKSDITLLRACGTVRVKSKNPLVKDRVAANDTSFKNGNLKVNSTLCPNVVEACEFMTYDQNQRPDKNLAVEHTFDAITYLGVYEFPVFISGSATTSQVRMW